MKKLVTLLIVLCIAAFCVAGLSGCIDPDEALPHYCDHQKC